MEKDGTKRADKRRNVIVIVSNRRHNVRRTTHQIKYSWSQHTVHHYLRIFLIWKCWIWKLLVFELTTSWPRFSPLSMCASLVQPPASSSSFPTILSLNCQGCFRSLSQKSQPISNTKQMWKQGFPILITIKNSKGIIFMEPPFDDWKPELGKWLNNCMWSPVRNDMRIKEIFCYPLFQIKWELSLCKRIIE